MCDTPTLTIYTVDESKNKATNGATNVSPNVEGDELDHDDSGDDNEEGEGGEGAADGIQDRLPSHLC